jgi:uncharacterized membrane protein (UPF0136 family)
MRAEEDAIATPRAFSVGTPLGRGGTATAEEVGRPESRPPRRWGLIAVAVVTSVGLHLPGMLVHLFNSDESSLATMAMVIDSGGRMYHDTADRKPPAVPYVYAAVFGLTGSRDLRPVRGVAALAVAATAVLLAVEAERRYRSRKAAWAALVLFLLGSAAFFPADTQAAGFELFMLLPMTAAVVAAGRNRAVTAGLCLALACLCKQTAIATALPIAWLLWTSGGWRQVARAAAAGAAVIGLTALAFGPSDFLLWTVTGNGGYMAHRGSITATIGRGMAMTAAFVGINLALVLLALWAARCRTAGPDLWMWLAGGAVAVLAGLRFFGHYYLQMVPPLALIAAGALPLLVPVLRRLAVGVTAVGAAVMVAVAFLPADERGLLPYGAVAAEVRRITGPDDTVFVWGEFPEIYWASGREPATRFIHTGFLTGVTGGRDDWVSRPSDGLPGAWALLDQDFAAHPAALIVDTSGTRIRGARFFPLDRTAFWGRIRGDYVLLGTVDGVRFYRNKAAPGPP